MSSIDKLARRLARVERVANEALNAPRLIAASMPKGASIDVIDPETDQPVMVIGEQHDGTVGAYPLDGPVPPVPSAPVVESGPLTLAVTYDGRMASEADRFPMDGEHIEVYAWPAGTTPEDVQEPDTEPVPDPADDPDDPTPPEPAPGLDDLPDPDLGEPELVGVLPAGGGTYPLARPAGSWGITFRTKTLAGRRSAHSGMAFGEIIGPANLAGIDEDARARNEEIAADLEQAQQNLDTARQLLEALRERTGRKVWTAPITDTPRMTIQPLGGGRVRFTSKYPGNTYHRWAFPTGTPAAAEDVSVVEVTFPAAGTHDVTYQTTGPAGGANWTGAFTLTESMMGPDYGWTDLTLTLDQLTAPDGPLSPEALAQVWLPAVAGAFVVATEAFVGPAALIDGIVQARHMAVVSELPNGARLSILEDGVRMWRAGNTDGQPNVMLTVGDGFRLQRDDGTSLLWIDVATGNLNTAGAVLSNSKIVAPEVTGGVVTGATVRTAETGQRVVLSSGLGAEIFNAADQRVLWVDPVTGNLRTVGAVQTGGEVRGAALYVDAPGGGTVFSATPTGGVVIGGGGAVYDRAGPWTTDEDSHWITDEVPVTPGATYGWRFRLQGSAGFTSEANYVEVIFRVGAAEVGQLITTQGGLHTVGSTQGLIEGKIVAPAGASWMRLRYRRTDAPPPLPSGQYVQFSQVRITAVAAGTIDVAGSVKSPRIVGDVVEAGAIRGSNGVAWDPSDTGPMTFNLSGDWQQSQGAPRRRKRGDLVYLSGEVVALNAAAGDGRPITTLPPGWRPARRLRVPWGWGDSLTYVVVETDGKVWSGPNARTTSPGMSLDAIQPFSTTA